MNVGIVGVGTMGSQMCKRLLEAGHTVFAVDIDAKAQKRAQEMGATVVAQPKAAAEKAAVVLLSLPMPKDVDEVVGGENGILSTAASGSSIVDLSTVDPGTTQRNAEKASALGIGYIDAPVLGRPQACGNWALPIGGEVDDLDQVRPVLGVLAKRIVHVGGSGHGNIVKLLNNSMFGAINAITVEIMAVCTKLGMDPKVLFDTIAESNAASVSNLFKELGPKILDRDFSPAFAIDLLHKDMSLAIKMAEEAGVPLFVSRSNQLLNEVARGQGLGSEDTSAAVKVYESLVGIEVRPASE